MKVTAIPVAALGLYSLKSDVDMYKGMGTSIGKLSASLDIAADTLTVVGAAVHLNRKTQIMGLPLEFIGLTARGLLPDATSVDDNSKENH